MTDVSCCRAITLDLCFFFSNSDFAKFGTFKKCQEYYHVLENSVKHADVTGSNPEIFTLTFLPNDLGTSGLKCV